MLKQLDLFARYGILICQYVVEDVLRKSQWIVAGTEDRDTDNDIIMLNGLSIVDYMKNPKLMYEHGFKPEVQEIGKVTALRREGNKLLALPEYDASRYAKAIEGFTNKGYMRASSIAVKPTEVVKNEFGGLTAIKSNLLEISRVWIPSNPNAMIPDAKTTNN